MSVVRSERLAASVAESYRATFAPADAPLRDGDVLPPAWEGLYFPFNAPLADLRPDGTPARDGVLPEIALPRRMYAGETTEFLAELALGDVVTQNTELGALVEKTGAAGHLIFADLVRSYGAAGAPAITSTWHDVFLEASDATAPVRPPKRDDSLAAGADWIDEVRLDARQLFRFSALTFNTHLIHYDREWARDVERLPDLLVHGPLTRILLMDAARRHNPGRRAQRLDVRAMAPMLVDRRVRFAGVNDPVRTTVTALDDDDVVLARATIDWRPATNQETLP